MAFSAFFRSASTDGVLDRVLKVDGVAVGRDECVRDSRANVTGPSLVRATDIIAPKWPSMDDSQFCPWVNESLIGTFNLFWCIKYPHFLEEREI